MDNQKQKMKKEPKKQPNNNHNNKQNSEAAIDPIDFLLIAKPVPYKKTAITDGKPQQVKAIAATSNERIKLILRSDVVDDEINDCEIIKSQRPFTSSRRRQFRNLYRVPGNVKNSILKNLNDLQLQEPLTPKNYVQRFRNLLWIEEVHHMSEMIRYEMKGVKFFRVTKSDFVAIKVPGLEEKRPSLIVGDKLHLRLCEDGENTDIFKDGCPIDYGQATFRPKKKNVCLEGFVHVIQEKRILVKLNDMISLDKACERTFNISFSMMRAPFIRSHLALERFNQDYLQTSTLFPKYSEKLIKDVEKQESLIDVRESVKNFNFIHKKLNTYQRSAVINILKNVCRPVPYIIIGPPGTGKTLTLVEAILQVYKLSPEAKILVCSNANASADSIMEKIIDSNIVEPDEMIRISAMYRLEDSEKHIASAKVREYSFSINDFDEEDLKYTRIIVTTCIQAGCFEEFVGEISDPNYELFDYVFIDECGHASEPQALIPLSFLKKRGAAAISGDPCQLDPVVLSNTASDAGLSLSLLERLYDLLTLDPEVDKSKEKSAQDTPVKRFMNDKCVTMLKISYRNDPNIMRISNRIFYKNQLEYANQTPQHWKTKMQIDFPMIYEDVRGNAERHFTSPSWFNSEEIAVSYEHIVKFMKNGMKPTKIAFLSPYREQVTQMAQMFKMKKTEPCRMGTMEEFQGLESEVVIISTVRTQDKNFNLESFKRSFLCQPKRFNVAVSRAKWFIILVGSRPILSHDPLWNEYIETCVEHKTFKNESKDEKIKKNAKDLSKLTSKPVDEIPPWKRWPKKRKNKNKSKGGKEVNSKNGQHVDEVRQQADMTNLAKNIGLLSVRG